MAATTRPTLDGSTSATPNGSLEHLDVLIVGAGLSGIGAACRLSRESPGKTFAVLESRPVSGGTWDLFRYPGIRSDSDMLTMCHPFRPWRGSTAIADGPSILAYVRETARECGVSDRIRYSRRVVAASWSSASARWRVEIERTDTGERRGIDGWPRQATRDPWRLHQSYARDLAVLRRGSTADDALEFSERRPPAPPALTARLKAAQLAGHPDRSMPAPDGRVPAAVGTPSGSRP